MSEEADDSDFFKYWEDYCGYLKIRRMVGAHLSTGQSQEVSHIHSRRIMLFNPGSSYDLYRFSHEKNLGSGVRSTDHLHLSDWDVFMQSSVERGGLFSSAHIGSYYASGGTYDITNVAGFHRVFSTPLGYTIQFYTTNFQAMKSQIHIRSDNGNVIVSGTSAGGQPIAVTLDLANNLLVLRSPTITLETPTMTFNGNLTVNGTFSTTGRSQLHGSRIDTGV